MNDHEGWLLVAKAIVDEDLRYLRFGLEYRVEKKGLHAAAKVEEANEGKQNNL